MILKKKHWTVAALVFGFLFGWLFLHQDPAFAEETKAEPKSPEKVFPKEASSDTNRDGKPDSRQYFGSDGKIIKVEADTNFDDKVDQWAYYENGKLVRVEKDSNYDGKVDGWVKY